MIQVELKFSLILNDQKVCVQEDWVLDNFRQMDVLLSKHQTLRKRVFDETEQTVTVLLTTESLSQLCIAIVKSGNFWAKQNLTREVYSCKCDINHLQEITKSLKQTLLKVNESEPA